MRLAVVFAAALLVTCTAPPTPPGPPLPVVELKYRVFEQVGRPWYCDPDFYPIQRQDEALSAEERLPEIQRDAETYAAILRHNDLAGAPLTTEQRLAVYRDWKQLNALVLEPVGDVYGFAILVRTSDKGGTRASARIDRSGRITVINRQDAGPPNCPICLASTTLIDTPAGPRSVTDLRAGDLVWSEDAGGRREAVAVRVVASVDAPIGHAVVRVTLADGRTVTASPGHPLGDGRLMGALRPGDLVDGARVTAVARLPYAGQTWDLLPTGRSGTYWAGGVLLRTTLAGR